MTENAQMRTLNTWTSFQKTAVSVWTRTARYKPSTTLKIQGMNSGESKLPLADT